MLKTIEFAIVKAPTTKQIKGTLLNLKTLAIKTANKIIPIPIIQAQGLELKSLLYHGKGTFLIKEKFCYCILQGGFGRTSILASNFCP